MITRRIIETLKYRGLLKEKTVKPLSILVRNYTSDHSHYKILQALHQFKGYGDRFCADHGPDLCPRPDKTNPERYAIHQIDSETEPPYQYLLNLDVMRGYLTFVFSYDMEPLLVVATKKERNPANDPFYRIVSRVVWTEGDPLA